MGETTMKNRIKELRLKHNLTLRQLGKELDMYDSRISQYETGKRQPKLETWQKLADYFNVSVPYLQGFTDNYKSNGTCDYCDFSKRDRAAYPLYGANDTFLGFVYLENDRTIVVDLMKVGILKTKDQVNGCPNCRRDLRNEQK